MSIFYGHLPISQGVTQLKFIFDYFKNVAAQSTINIHNFYPMGNCAQCTYKCTSTKEMRRFGIECMPVFVHGWSTYFPTIGWPPSDEKLS